MTQYEWDWPAQRAVNSLYRDFKENHDQFDIETWLNLVLPTVFVGVISAVLIGMCAVGMIVDPNPHKNGSAIILWNQHGPLTDMIVIFACLTPAVLTLLYGLIRWALPGLLHFFIPRRREIQ